LALLSNAIRELPIRFKHLEAQITQGLFQTLKKTRGKSGYDYVSFSFDPNLINEFENRKERNYRIKGIKLYDSLTKKKLDFTIYVYSGVIGGYLIEGANEFDIDVSLI